MAWEQGENPDDLALSRTRPDAAVAVSRGRITAAVRDPAGRPAFVHLVAPRLNRGPDNGSGRRCSAAAAQRNGRIMLETLTTWRPAGGPFQDFVARWGTDVSPTGFIHCPRSIKSERLAPPCQRA